MGSYQLINQGTKRLCFDMVTGENMYNEIGTLAPRLPVVDDVRVREIWSRPRRSGLRFSSWEKCDELCRDSVAPLRRVDEVGDALVDRLAG